MQQIVNKLLGLRPLSKQESLMTKDVENHIWFQLVLGNSGVGQRVWQVAPPIVLGVAADPWDAAPWDPDLRNNQRH